MKTLWHFNILLLIWFVFLTKPLPVPGQNGENSNHKTDFGSLYKITGKKESSVTPSLTEPVVTWKEHWNKHNLTIGRFYINRDTHVVIYFDDKLSTSITRKTSYRLQANFLDSSPHWLFKFTSDVWSYMTETYGNFGPDPYLYIVAHKGTYSGTHFGFSLDPGNVHERKNVLDITFLRQKPLLTNQTKSFEMSKLLNKLAHFVERSSKGRFGSPSYNVWHSSSHVETPWVDTFTFDVYTNLNMTTEADSYKEMAMKKSNNSPKEFVYWFRDWFWPIYSKYGGNTVLNNYFSLLAQHLPHQEVYYDLKFDVGGFVYFWSAAAKSNLIPLATTAFGWNETFQTQFMIAKSRFHIYWADKDGLTTEFLKLVDFKNDTSTIITGMGPETIIALSILFVILIIGFGAFYIFHRRKVQQLQLEIRALTTEEVNEFFEGDKSLDPDEAQALVLSMPFITDFEIPREQMILDHTKVLGSGQFGTVIHGIIQQSDQLKAVAVKTVKPSVDVVYFKSFLSEVKIMAYLGKHPHIVELLGTYTANIREREIFIALEFCNLGNLENYLKKNRDDFEFNYKTYDRNSFSSDLILQFTTNQNPTDAGPSSESTPLHNRNKITTLDLIKWSQDISNAMMYLTQKKVIHGDLAARNILLTESRIAKISDFGLSRKFLNYANYMKTSKLPVPWRWLAIESLKDMKFSTASDIWAFGVTLWEIFSLAEIPYGAWTYDLFFADKLVGGERLLIPKYASQQVYNIMTDCWKVEPNERPSFQQIHSRLQEFIARPSSYSRASGRSASTEERRNYNLKK